MFSHPVTGESQSVFSGVFARNGWAEGTVGGTGALISHRRREQSHSCCSEEQNAPISQQQIEKSWVED